MRNSTTSRTMRKTRFTIILAVFILASVAHLYAAAIQCEWTDVKRIVAVGDIHGDYKAFIEILEGTGIIDNELNWIGKETHLVQIGDVLDRGPDAKKIFDLLMKLEKEAKKAGGEVHMLIGNHEEMNIGDVAFDREGYITPGQFVSFLPDGYRKRLEKRIRKQLAENNPNEKEYDSSLDGSLLPFWEKIIVDARNAKYHPARRAYVENFNRTYGKWIAKQNAVIRINDIIFVHGGISERFSTWKLKTINNRLRVELEDLRRAEMTRTRARIETYQRQILYVPDGPYWFRDYATKNPTVYNEIVGRVLSNLNADKMVIAHTPKIIRSLNDMKLFKGKIWIIDTGISEYYRKSGGKLSALIIEDGEFIPWGLDDEKQKDSHNSIYFLFLLWGLVSLKIPRSLPRKN